VTRALLLYPGSLVCPAPILQLYFPIRITVLQVATQAVSIHSLSFQYFTPIYSPSLSLYFLNLSTVHALKLSALNLIISTLISFQDLQPIPTELKSLPSAL
jgi:hypothetical protein